MTRFYDYKLETFVHSVCPRPNHCCNGKALQDKNYIDLPPCEYYKKGCQHPQHPKKNIEK